MANYLTFDIEEWFRVNYRNCGIPADEPDTHLEPMVETLLEICGEHDARCTFFVLGTVAETYPELVRRIHAQGHEIASHGYSHRTLLAMTEAEFREDTRQALDLLQSTIGAPVLGYRAPSFSVSAGNAVRYYRVLAELGFRYSSSVFPGKTFLYGIPGFPHQPHRPAIDGEQMSILEFPISRIDLPSWRIPLYLRLFPATVLRDVIRRRNRKGESVMLYLHPREIDPEQPRLNLPRAQSIIHYWGIRGCKTKLRRLLASRPPLSRICDTPDLCVG